MSGNAGGGSAERNAILAAIQRAQAAMTARRTEDVESQHRRRREQQQEKRREARAQQEQQQLQAQREREQQEQPLPFETPCDEPTSKELAPSGAPLAQEAEAGATLMNDARDDAPLPLLPLRSDAAADAPLAYAPPPPVEAPASTIVVPIRKPASATYISAAAQREEFFSLWAKKIQMFVEDQTRSTLVLPTELTANDRRELHALAAKFNLSHYSEGTGASRHLVLKKDELHFKALPSAVDAELIVGELLEEGGAATGGSHRHTGGDGFHGRAPREKKKLVADKEAIKAFNRLMRATDQFSDAIDSEFTLEDLAAAASAGGGGATLLHASSSGGGGGINSASDALWSAALRQREPQGSSQLTAPPPQPTDAVAAGVSLTGQKRGRDGDGEQLEEYDASNVGVVAAPERLDQQRRRMENSTAEPAQKPRATDGDGAPTEEPVETLSLEEAVSIARVNDVPDADVAWIEEFATRFHPGETLEQWLQFPIDFEEARLLQVAAVVEDECVMLCKERPASDGGGVPAVPVSECLRAVFDAMTVATARAAIVVFPGVSLYGDAMVVAVVVSGDAEFAAACRGRGDNRPWASRATLLEGCITVGGRELLKGAF